MELDKTELRNSSQHIYVTVYYDDVLKATVDVWTGKFENHDNFKKGLFTVLENIKKFDSKKWLADLTLMEGEFEMGRDFIAHNIVPQAMRYGLRYEAVVLPDNIFSMLSVQETLEKISDLEIRIFGNREGAITWLNSKSMKE